MSAPVSALASPGGVDWSQGPPALSDEQLARYLAFLGVSGRPFPTLAALERLQLAHLLAIPFENLSSLAGRPVSVELSAIVEKLLSGERGGYCFEHNLLLAGALRALGFRVQLMAGRPVLVPGALLPRTHLALRVQFDSGDVLSDVGFGRASLRAPIAIAAVEHEPGDEPPFQVRETASGELLVCARPGDDADDPEDLYLLDPRPIYKIDVALANLWVSTDPSSIMRSRAIVLRPLPEGKRSILGRRFVVREPGREVDRELELHEVDAVLREEFGIVLPEPLRALPA